MNRVEFKNSQRKVKITNDIKHIIAACVDEVSKQENIGHNISVDVLFLSDSSIKKINKAHRNKNMPTDVLSFPNIDFKNGKLKKKLTAHDFYDNTLMLGDIVISLEKAQSQALEYNHSFMREVAFLCVHSLLHLLGYDHERGNSDMLLMRNKEEKVLTSLGLVR